tara:strand:- start:2462 stop:3337 length:876 start_codon:yes stop_codon:yes gene_type:complete
MKGKIAFLGTGLMGEPMAANLINSGYQVFVWNRSKEKTNRLKSIGGNIVSTPQNAVKDADIIFTMLENGSVVRDILFKSNLNNIIKSGATVIDTSSIPPDWAKEHASLLSKRGVAHIDAPVSGGTTGAIKGSLAIMAGGQVEEFKAVEDVFSPLGKVVYVGPPGSGQLCKLANQIICGGYLVAVAEGLHLASKGGADIIKVREALMGGFADSQVLHIHGERMVNREFEPGGKCRIFVKDLETVKETSNQLNINLQMADLIRKMYLDVVNLGFGENDQASILLAVEDSNSKK